MIVIRGLFDAEKRHLCLYGKVLSKHYFNDVILQHSDIVVKRIDLIR